MALIQWRVWEERKRPQNKSWISEKSLFQIKFCLNLTKNKSISDLNVVYEPLKQISKLIIGIKDNHFKSYTIMLLMGMWISLTKNPMNPIMANPMAVAIAIFWNSKGLDKSLVPIFLRLIQFKPFLSGFVHLLTKRIESLANCRPGSTNDITWSMSCLKVYLNLKEKWVKTWTNFNDLCLKLSQELSQTLFVCWVHVFNTHSLGFRFRYRFT